MSYVRLIETFVAEEEGELSVTKGDVVFVIEEDQDGWTFAQYLTGEAGLIPTAYTEPCEPPQLEEPEPETEPEPAPTIPKIEPLAVPTKEHTTPTQSPRKSSPISRISTMMSPRGSTKSQPALASNGGERASVTVLPTTKKAAQDKSNLVQLNPVILRVYTNEDIHKEIEEKDLSNPRILKTFKSIRATGQTPVRQIIEDVAKKLLLPDSRPYHLYIIDRKAMQMKLLQVDDRPVEIFNNSPTEVQFALIYAPKVKVKEIKTKMQSDVRWQTAPGELTHRRLINDQPYLKFADFIVNLGNIEIATFQAIVEIRFPSLLEVDASLVKKKKEKNMAHGVGVWLKFNDGLFTIDIFHQIFDFMYTGKMEIANLDLEKIIQIYSAAMKLRYTALEQYLRSQMESSIGLHNVFLALKFSDENKLTELKNFSINYCLNNWTSVSASKDGLAIIGLSLFQEMTVQKAQMTTTPPLLEPTPPPPNTIVEDFQKVRSLMHFADAVSVFGGTIIPYHRCILSAASPKFLTMFLKESGSSKKKLAQYQFDNISGGAFKGLIDLIYSGTTNINLNEACELLEHIAVPFELHSVQKHCEDLICQEDQIAEDNVMNILRITYLKSSEGRAHLTIKARSNCLAFICAHFRDIEISQLKDLNLDPSSAWELLEMLHSRFRKHDIVGLE